ncbi:hypothetical protein ACLKA6_011500 [Drosophila palustris]
MRSMPMFLRMAEELSRFPRMSPFQAFFHEPLMWSGVAVPRNWQQIAHWQEQEFAPTAKVEKQGYQVSVDVSVYKPSELTVKTVDNSVIIEGKSEQQDEQGGYTSRHFLRRFVLPEGYESDKVTSTLSSDGLLTINVPNPPEVEEALKERLVPIQHMGPAKANPNATQEETDK